MGMAMDHENWESQGGTASSGKVRGGGDWHTALNLAGHVAHSTATGNHAKVSSTEDDLPDHEWVHNRVHGKLPERTGPEIPSKYGLESERVKEAEAAKQAEAAGRR
jgi:hypothetical protein